MSQFLWIEDFESERDNPVSSFTEAVFGEILTKQPEDAKEEVKKTLKECGVLLECTFLDGLEFIRDPEKLFQVDYIILDVDLIIKDDIDENGILPDIIELYRKELEKTPEEALKEVAGYQLYIELVMALDFPKDHILFCSNHIEQLESLKDAFQKAKIQLPPTPHGKLALSKAEPDRKALREWIRKRRNNPYSTLRRGIIEGCQHIQKHLTIEIPFSKFCTKKNRQNVTAQNIRDYLITLQNFLPLREPSDAKPLYKLFIRTLSHEWEDDFKPDNLKLKDVADNESILKCQRMFGGIIKCVRNWTAHAQILDELSECDVAFLFIVAMRAMFKLFEKTEGYENILFNLFTDKLEKQKLKMLIEQHSNNILLSKCTKSYSELLKAYAKVLKNKGELLKPPTSKQLDFSTILENMQYWDKNNKAQFNYVMGLFQMFWHGLSPIIVKSRPPIQDHQKISFEYEYDFDLNDYGKDDMDSFLFEFACCIYKRSFPDT
ncbi:hypothetical protein [Candidatus Parabeggiatoa sp. HSG14]|uniref:hypothetical protein n=1 Tax=Candidatus Parabeggiatoa sp. HSG14 TaxID=3055593 RepID=UPI0025A7198A|nr:hypothetical protein [Thiotrichales bacterium HSG14]